MRNEITTPKFRRIDADTVEVTMTLEPLETVLLVFQPQKIYRPQRIEPDTKPIREPIAIGAILIRPVIRRHRTSTAAR